MDLIDQGHTHPPIIKRSFLYTKSPGATLGSTSRDNKTLFLDDKNTRGIKQSKRSTPELKIQKTDDDEWNRENQKKKMHSEKNHNLRCFHSDMSRSRFF